MVLEELPLKLGDFAAIDGNEGLVAHVGAVGDDGLHLLQIDDVLVFEVEGLLEFIAFDIDDVVDADGDLPAFGLDEEGNLVSKQVAAANAIMTSYNRVGGVWSGASPIISGILRKECGFLGSSFTDAGGTIDGYMNTAYFFINKEKGDFEKAKTEDDEE